MLALTLLAFWPTIDNGFTNWDDPKYVTENWTIRDPSWGNVRKYFSSFQMGSYHPLTLLSYALDHRLFGLAPRGFHATSLLLHLVSTGMVFLVLRQLECKPTAAALGALFFGIHPLRVESVAWVSGRKDLLCAVFFLAALAAYLQYLRRGKNPWQLAACLLFFLLALLSKAMAVTFPLIMFLCDYLFRRTPDKRAILEKLPFLLLSAIGAWLAYIAQKSGGGFRLGESSTILDVLTPARSVVLYLSKTALPLGLSAIYPYPERTGVSLPLEFLVAPLLIATAVVGVWYSLRFTRKVAFGALWFFLTLLPVLQIVPLGYAYAADRYSYLPAVGLAYLAGEGFSNLSGRSHSSTTFTTGLRIALVCLTTALFLLTWNRTTVWKNSLTLWNDVISRHPGVAVAYRNRGFAFAETGDRVRALDDFRRSLELAPAEIQSYLNLANALIEAGRLEEAVSVCRRALLLEPNHEIHHNLGAAVERQGKTGEAVENYRLALRLRPDYAPSHVNLGVLLAEAGRLEDAVSHYRAALRSEPYHAEAHYNLAMDLETMGRLGEAAGHLRSFLKLRPGNARATADLKRILSGGGANTSHAR